MPMNITINASFSYILHLSCTILNYIYSTYTYIHTYVQGGIYIYIYSTLHTSLYRMYAIRKLYFEIGQSIHRFLSTTSIVESPWRPQGSDSPESSLTQPLAQ